MKKKLFKIVPPIICAIFVVICLIFFSKADFEDILNYTPDNLFLAALTLWFFYALKSLSIMFPATVFFIVAGLIYPYPIAVLVNIVGLAVSFAIPYFIGRASGSEAAEAIEKKYPKAGKIVASSRKNNFLAVYVSRAITVVPNDLVSMLHGAIGMPFVPFIIGSVVGILPEMLVETYIGGQLSDLSISSVLVMLALIAVTLVLSMAINKKISGRFSDDDE